MNSDMTEVLLSAESGVFLEHANLNDEEGSTPLMYWAANGIEKAVRSLIQAGVDVNQQNHYGWTALLQAACYGHHEVVYTLLQNGASTDLCNYWGITPLVAAAQGGFITIVKALLEKDTDAVVCDEVLSLTPLMAASQCGNQTVVEVLLDHGANPNTRYSLIGWTALMFATINNHLSVVKVLIDRGAMTEMRNVNNHRAIDLATFLGFVEVASFLSGDVSAAPSCDTDIFEAVKQDNVKMLTEVIGKQKVSTTVTDKDGATPLMYAVKKGNVQACQVLLDHGADCDAQDQILHWTAFMHAVHHGQYKIAKLLAEYGANVNLRAKNGSSAFDIANLIGDTHTIQLIAETTIQRLKERKESPLFFVEEKNKALTKEFSHTTQSPSIGSDDNEVTSILRRVSNAYLASGSTNLPSHADLGFNSPFCNPSPDLSQINEKDEIPSNPSFTVTPFKQQILSSNTPLPILLEQHIPKHLSNLNPDSSVVHKVPSSPLSGRQFPSRLKPHLRLTLSPFANEEQYKKNVLHIKSPRSLPSDTFKLLKKPPTATAAVSLKCNSTFIRSSSRHILPSTLTSSTEKSQIGESNRFEWSRHPYNSLRSSLDNIELFKNGQDLKAILFNSSLGHYYSKFEEEELDVNSFLTLSEQDLIDLGVKTEEDRTKVMGIILQLKEHLYVR